LSVCFTPSDSTPSLIAPVEKVSWNGNIWKLCSPTDDGKYEVRCQKDIRIPPSNGQGFKLATDLKFQLPKDTYCEVSPSSQKESSFLQVSGGVLDNDYSGHLGLVVHNPSSKSVFIKNGAVVCTLSFKRISKANVGNRSVESSFEHPSSVDNGDLDLKVKRMESLFAAVLEKMSFLESNLDPCALAPP